MVLQTTRPLSSGAFTTFCGAGFVVSLMNMVNPLSLLACSVRCQAGQISSEESTSLRDLEGKRGLGNSPELYSPGRGLCLRPVGAGQLSCCADRCSLIAQSIVIDTPPLEEYLIIAGLYAFPCSYPRCSGYLGR